MIVMINDCFDDELADITLAELNSSWNPISPPPWELPTNIIDGEVEDADFGLVLETLPCESSIMASSAELKLQEPIVTNDGETDQLEPAVIQEKESNTGTDGHDGQEKLKTQQMTSDAKEETNPENDGNGDPYPKQTRPTVSEGLNVQGVIHSESVTVNEIHHEDLEITGKQRFSVFHRTASSPNAKTALNSRQSQSPKCDNSETMVGHESNSANVCQHEDANGSVATTSTSPQPEVQVEPSSETTHDVDIGRNQKQIQEPGIADQLVDVDNLNGVKNNLKGDEESTPKTQIKEVTTAQNLVKPIPMKPVVKKPPPTQNRIVDPVWYSDRKNLPFGVKLHKATNRSPKCDNSETMVGHESNSANVCQHEDANGSVATTSTSPQPEVQVEPSSETTHDVDIGRNQKQIQEPGIADQLVDVDNLNGVKNNLKGDEESTPKTQIKEVTTAQNLVKPIPMKPVVKKPPPTQNRIVDPVWYSDRKNLPFGVKLHKATNRLLYDQNLEYIGATGKGNGRDVARYGTGDEDFEVGTLVRMFDSISKMMYTGIVCDFWDGVVGNNPADHMGKHYYVVFDHIPNVDFTDYENVSFPQSQLQLFNGKKLDTRSVPRRGRKPAGYDVNYYSPSTLPEGVIVELHGYEGVDLIVAGKISREKGYIFNRFSRRTGKVKGARTSFIFGYYEQLADLTPERKNKFYSWLHKRESGDKLSIGAEAGDLSKGRQTRSSNQSSAADDSSLETYSLASESSGHGSATASELQGPETKLMKRRGKLKSSPTQGPKQSSEEPEVQKKPVEPTESKKGTKKKETPAGGQRSDPMEMVQCRDHVSAAAHNSLEKHCSELQADLNAARREKAELVQRLKNVKVDQSSSVTKTTTDAATIMEANLNIDQLKELVEKLTGFLRDIQNSQATNAAAAGLISETVPYARKRVQQKRVQESSEDSNGLATTGMQPAEGYMKIDENELEKSLGDVVIENELEERQQEQTSIKTPTLLFTPSPATKRLTLDQVDWKSPGATRQTSQTRILPTRNSTASQDQQGIQPTGYFVHENPKVLNRGPYSRDNSPKVLPTTTRLIHQTRNSRPTPTPISSGYNYNMINQTPFQAQRGHKSISNRVVSADVSVDPRYVRQRVANVANHPDGDISMAQLNLEGIIRTPENEDPHSQIFETNEFHAAAQFICTQLQIPVGEGSFLERAIKTAFWCEAISVDMDEEQVVPIMTVFERFHKWRSQTSKPIDMCYKSLKRFVGRYKNRAPAKRPLEGGYSIRPQFKIPRGLSPSNSAPLPNPPSPIRGGRRGRPKNSGAFSSMVYTSGQRQDTETPPPFLLVQTSGVVASHPKESPPPTPDHHQYATLLDQDEDVGDDFILVDDEVEEDWQNQQANSWDTKAPSSLVKENSAAQCMTSTGYQLDSRLEALFEGYMGYFTERQLMSLGQTDLKPKKGKDNTIVQTGKAMMYGMITFLSQNGCFEFTMPGTDHPPFLIAMQICSDIGLTIKREADCVKEMEVIVIESALLWACLVKIIRHLKPMAGQLEPLTAGARMFIRFPKIVVAHFVRMVRQAYLRAGIPIPQIQRPVHFDNEPYQPHVHDQFNVEQEDEFEDEPHEVLDINNWPQANQNGHHSGDHHAS